MNPSTPRITPDTVRQLAAAAGIRPEQADLAALAQTLGTMLATIERCEALNLAQHEPATTFRPTSGAADADR